MNIKPKQLSIIIAAYNDSKCIGQCLSSIKGALGGRPVEIIVVDDASTDETLGVAKEFDVNCIRNESNLGQSKSRNRGAALASGEYLLFIDSDVVVPPDCFAVIEDFFAKDKDEGLVGMQGIFSLEHPFDEWYSLCYNTLQYLLKSKPGYTTGVNASFFLIKKEEFDELDGFSEDINFLEDVEFGRRLAASGKYLSLGPIQFIHVKRVRIGWFYHCFIIGGKMLGIIKKRTAPTRNDALPLPKEAKGISPFYVWLIEGFSLFVLFLLPISITMLFNWAYYALLSCIVFLVFFINFRILWKVKPNPIFFIFCSLNYMLLPWLGALGVCSVLFSRRHNNCLKRWNSSRL